MIIFLILILLNLLRLILLFIGRYNVIIGSTHGCSEIFCFFMQPAKNSIRAAFRIIIILLYHGKLFFSQNCLGQSRRYLVTCILQLLLIDKENRRQMLLPQKHVRFLIFICLFHFFVFLNHILFYLFISNLQGHDVVM